MKKITLKKKRLTIDTHGYAYSSSDFLTTLVIFVCSTTTICYLHKLNPFYTLIVLGTILLSLPILISSFFMYKHEKKRFEEYCKYFEYMKIYFKTYKKIKLALEQVAQLFDERCHMYRCIERAIEELNQSGDYQTALHCIEKDYHNSYLERFHNLLITGEEHGSDSVYENLDAINYDAWKEDIQLHQNKKRTFRYMLYGMTLFSLFLSYYGVHMFADVLMDIHNDPSYQMYTFANVEGILVLFMVIYVSFVNKKWIRSDD